MLNLLTHLKQYSHLGTTQYSVWLKVKKKAIKGFCCNSRYFSHSTSFLAMTFEFYIFLLGGVTPILKGFSKHLTDQGLGPSPFTVIICYDSNTVCFGRVLTQVLISCQKMNRLWHLLSKYFGENWMFPNGNIGQSGIHIFYTFRIIKQ